MNPLDYPIVASVVSVAVLWLSAHVGDYIRKRIRPLEEEERDVFSVVLGANLTLLGLLIGFTFSMATSRYDQRKNCEEGEANAIGTEYLRADLLPVGQADRVRKLLKSYMDQRVQFYTTRNQQNIAKINADTTELQNELWSAVRPGPDSQPTPILALAVSGMNDVLNSQGYTQAAWWNRIPMAAWALMMAIAVCCNVLIGYDARVTSRRTLLILPLAVSISFFLVSDIDCPNGGAVRVAPHNLLSVSQSWPAQ